MLHPVLAIPSLLLSHFLRAAAMLMFLALPAHAGSANIVISQVYGGGGTAGAAYKDDFVELFNRGPAAIDVSGWTVQYAAASGSAWASTELTGSIPPGGYYLIQQSSAGAVGAAMPTPDFIGGTALSSIAGKLALVSSATLLNVACPVGGAIVDFVGYGTTASCFEGAAATAAPASTTSVLRAGAGCTETDDNVADFSAGTPLPRNSAASPNVCSLPPSSGSLNIVISQAYGGGGTAGAVYKDDFVELFNRGPAAIDVSGWTVQYAAASGSAWASTELTGSIPPGGYYLIQQSSAGAVGAAMPTPDFIGGTALSSIAGKLALVSSATLLNVACPVGGAIVDFVGYGTTASCFEGAAATAAPASTTSVLRSGAGCTDTDDNAANFSVDTPLPRNSATSPNVCARVPGTPVLNQVTIGPGSATLNFTAVAQIGSVANTYTARCTATGHITRSQSGGGSPITVLGLTGGVVYSCSVTASNEFGSSATSPVMLATPLKVNDLTPILMLLLD